MTTPNGSTRLPRSFGLSLSFFHTPSSLLFYFLRYFIFLSPLFHSLVSLNIINSFQYLFYCMVRTINSQFTIDCVVIKFLTTIYLSKISSFAHFAIAEGFKICGAMPIVRERERVCAFDTLIKTFAIPMRWSSFFPTSSSSSSSSASSCYVVFSVFLSLSILSIGKLHLWIQPSAKSYSSFIGYFKHYS